MHYRQTEPGSKGMTISMVGQNVCASQRRGTDTRCCVCRHKSTGSLAVSWDKVYGRREKHHVIEALSSDIESSDTRILCPLAFHGC